jgi:hypothetical protein
VIKDLGEEGERDGRVGESKSGRVRLKGGQDEEGGCTCECEAVNIR